MNEQEWHEHLYNVNEKDRIMNENKIKQININIMEIKVNYDCKLYLGDDGDDCFCYVNKDDFLKSIESPTQKNVCCHLCCDRVR